MIGPSAPNGPPEPIEIADESGLSSATFGSIRLPLIRMASMRFGDAVAADPLGAVARHQADDQAAGHRHEHAEPGAERGAGGGTRRAARSAGRRTGW